MELLVAPTVCTQAHMLLLLQHPILAQAEEPAMVQGLALEPAGELVVVSVMVMHKVIVGVRTVGGLMRRLMF